MGKDPIRDNNDFIKQVACDILVNIGLFADGIGFVFCSCKCTCVISAIFCEGFGFYLKTFAGTLIM